MNNYISSSPSQPRNPLADISLEQLPVPLREAATRTGWTSLVPVQARATPYLLAAFTAGTSAICSTILDVAPFALWLAGTVTRHTALIQIKRSAGPGRGRDRLSGGWC